MFAAKALFCVRLPEFTRSTTFRWTLVASGAFTLCILLMFGFVLAQAYWYMAVDVDGLNAGVAESIATKDGLEARIGRLEEYLRVDPHNVKLGGLFDAAGQRIAGNIESLPPELSPGAGPQLVSLVKIGVPSQERRSARAEARRLPDGSMLVVARLDYEITWIVRSLERALALGLIPALCLGLGAGAFLSIRAQRRVEEVNRKIKRIVAGD